jgi:coniferyl-aldehyde dehydrogenase
METLGDVHGIDYRERNLRRFMRPTRRRIPPGMRFGSNRMSISRSMRSASSRRGTIPGTCSLMPVVTAIAAGNHLQHGAYHHG